MSQPTLIKRAEIEFWTSLNTEIKTWDSFMIKENEKKSIDGSSYPIGLR